MTCFKTSWVVLLLILINTATGFAGGPSPEERNRREREFLSDYRSATDQKTFLIDHLKSSDEIEISNLIWMIRNKSRTLVSDGKPIPPQFKKAFRKWKNHPRTEIAKEAEKAAKEVEHYQFEEFKSEYRKGFVSPGDEKTFLSGYTATDNDLIKDFVAEKLGVSKEQQTVPVTPPISEEKRLPVEEKERQVVAELPKNPEKKAKKIAPVTPKKIKNTFNPVFDVLLADNISAPEKERLIRKYAASEKESDRTDVYRFMAENTLVDPQLFVPLLSEYFGPDLQNDIEIVSGYPELVDKGLHRCLYSWNGVRISGCIELITSLSKMEYIQDIFNVTFGELGYLNYHQPEATSAARIAALKMFSAAGEITLPQLTQIIYNDENFDDNKPEALRIIDGFNTKDSVTLLKRYSKSTSTYLDKKLSSSKTVREELSEMLSGKDLNSD